jgi:hypothetical protein
MKAAMWVNIYMSLKMAITPSKITNNRDFLRKKYALPLQNNFNQKKEV